ncbi:sigma 54-interacting transcriptional regulator [Clostridiaceae bacterium HSG29]|nr:sigma 54-interacting transcriptional regulator [Clostridiaceae bacterium HSG29]
MKYPILVSDFLNNMNDGLIYIDSDGIIQEYNEKAKQMMGIQRKCAYPHNEGKIEKGDIVIIAYTSFGLDDEGIDENDFKKIGLTFNNIEEGTTVLAVGKYMGNVNGKSKIKAPGAYMDVITLEDDFEGVHFKAKVDYIDRCVEIKINSRSYRYYYNNYFSNCVVLDKDTKEMKFYQQGGYTAWKEDLKLLLNGQFFSEKKVGINIKEVINKHIFEAHDNNEIIKEFISCAKGEHLGFKGKNSKLNGIYSSCTFFPVKRVGKTVGAYLLLSDISLLQSVETQKNIAYSKLKVVTKSLKDNEIIEKYFPKIIGSSKIISEIKRLGYKASRFQSNVLLLGESGTGKSILARAIHDASDNKNKPFIQVNCSSIPETLIESELFGYEKGAFTGANQKGKKGYFEMADSGTIFLDEIGDLPKAMQVKLLHVIQNKKFYKVGGDKEIEVDVRIIAATNRNLELDVKNKLFRKDLYYRINVFPIHIPSLRERIDDMHELVEYLLPKICMKIGTEEKRISGEAMAKLRVYHWPGNIRELENILERAVNLCDDKIITSDYIKVKINKKNLINQEEYLKPLKDSLNELELEIIENVMDYTNDDKMKTMKILKIKKTKLYDKLKTIKKRENSEITE